MLDKINKISTGSGFSKSQATPMYNAAVGSAYHHGLDRHDSAEISPAFKYMFQVHWRLIDFKFHDGDKLFLDFIVSGIEFKTTVDLRNQSKISSFNYHLYKEGTSGSSRKKIIADVTSKIEWINYDQAPGLINFSALNTFFNRIFEQKIYQGLTNTREDKYFFDDLLDGIVQGIRNEFSSLNNQVLILFDKLAGKKMPSNLSTADDYIEPVIINNVKIIDV